MIYIAKQKANLWRSLTEKYRIGKIQPEDRADSIGKSKFRRGEGDGLNAINEKKEAGSPGGESCASHTRARRTDERLKKVSR